MKFKDSGSIKKRLSIKNVAVDKNLYTLPTMSTVDKFILEKFYAENIDGAYAEVYNMLSDTSVIHIGPKNVNLVLFPLSIFPDRSIRV